MKKQKTNKNFNQKGNNKQNYNNKNNYKKEVKLIATDNKIIQKLRGISFLVYLLIASAIIQGFHSFYVFKELSRFNDTILVTGTSIMYAFVLSCAIIVYTLRGNKTMAVSFAIFEVGINLFYFFSEGANDLSHIIMKIGIAIILPLTTYFYTDESMKRIKINKT